MTRYHLLLSFVVTRTASKGTATSFSPAPRNPPTPTMSAVIFPPLSTSTSLTAPTLASLGSYTLCLYQLDTVTESMGTAVSTCTFVCAEAATLKTCLLYTSDAADDLLCV